MSLKIKARSKAGGDGDEEGQALTLSGSQGSWGNPERREPAGFSRQSPGKFRLPALLGCSWSGVFGSVVLAERKDSLTVALQWIGSRGGVV